MEFNFNLKDTKDCILFTEGKLQDLIHTIMTRERSPGWADDPNISWGKQKREGLVHRRDKRAEEYYAHTNSNRLIDYCYLLDLRELLIKNRATFEGIFKQWDRSMVMFEIIGSLRNTAMHPHEMPVYQQHLCLGICGEFLQILDAWELGRLRKIAKFACTMEWVDHSGGDKDAGLVNVIAQGQSWIDRIRGSAVGPISDIVIQGRGSGALEIPVKEGVVKISLPYRSPRDKPTASLYFETESFAAFDKILTDGGHGYWVLEWHMPDDLDVDKIVKRIDELTGKQMQYSRHPKNYDSRSTTYVEKAEGYILRNHGWELRVEIIGGNSNIGSRMDLIADPSNATNIFRNAHNILSPEIILSVLYGEKSMPEFRNLLQQAATPKPANPTP